MFHALQHDPHVKAKNNKKVFLQTLKIVCSLLPLRYRVMFCF